MQQTFDYLRGGYREVDPESRQRLEEHGYIERAKTSAANVLKSSINQPVVMIIGVLTVAAAFMMYAGGGDTLTWAGAILYFGSLLAFTFVAVRAARN